MPIYIGPTSWLQHHCWVCGHAHWHQSWIICLSDLTVLIFAVSRLYPSSLLVSYFHCTCLYKCHLPSSKPKFKVMLAAGKITLPAFGTCLLISWNGKKLWMLTLAVTFYRSFGMLFIEWGWDRSRGRKWKERMILPVRFSNQKPIEHTWDALGREIGTRILLPSRTIYDLKTKLPVEWD